MHERRELEICAETLQACIAADEGGADRIELCAALAEGGVTPGPGLVREALLTARIPVHVLVRPRSGNFLYSEAEFRMCCADADAALGWGAAGIVVGFLRTDGSVDEPRLQTLLKIANGRPVTFHRAFDHARDLPEALRVLIDLGCSRILTSGGKHTVTEGRKMLEEMAAVAEGRIRIAAGGGVTLQNAPTLTTIAGLDIHASLRRKTVAGAADVLWNADNDTSIRVDDVRALSAMVHQTA